MRILAFLLWCSVLCSAPKAIIFDFGGVIATSDKKPVLDYIQSTFKTNAKTEFEGDKLYIALAQGEGFWQNYAASHGKALPSGWMSGLEQRVAKLVRPTPGMEALIAQLKDKGYQIALLSNTTQARSTFYRKKGFYKPFNPIVLSWEFGVKKPDPGIYQIMLQELDLAADECIYIDNTEINITAAKKLGFHAILFKSTGQLRTDLRKFLPLKEHRDLPDARIGSLGNRS